MGHRALHGKPSCQFRKPDQLWRVLFAGERGHDAGGNSSGVCICKSIVNYLRLGNYIGLYRECWSMLAADLMSPTLPLLIPCPNSQGNFLMIYLLNFHVLNHFLLIYICKLHWNYLKRFSAKIETRGFQIRTATPQSRFKCLNFSAS